MMRPSDWPEILARQLLAGAERPFAWGEHDCCLWAADVVREMTGIDYAAAFRGRYATRLGAARALKRYGKGDLAATVAAVLGEPVDPRLARRGDVLLLETEIGPALGICAGVHGHFAAPAGLAQVETLACAQAWRID